MPGMRSGASSETQRPSCAFWQVTYQLKVQTQCAELMTMTSGLAARSASPIAYWPLITALTKSGAVASIPMRGVCGATPAPMIPPLIFVLLASRRFSLIEHGNAIDLDVDTRAVRGPAHAGARHLLAGEDLAEDLVEVLEIGTG